MRFKGRGSDLVTRHQLILNPPLFLFRRVARHVAPRFVPPASRVCNGERVTLLRRIHRGRETGSALCGESEPEVLRFPIFFREQLRRSFNCARNRVTSAKKIPNSRMTALRYCIAAPTSSLLPLSHFGSRTISRRGKESGTRNGVLWIAGNVSLEIAACERCRATCRD